MKRILPTIGFTALLYGVTLYFGLHVKRLTFAEPQDMRRGLPSSSLLSLSELPNDASGNRVRRGAQLFDYTSVYASSHARAKLSCSSCHAAGGIQPFAIPLIGAPSFFPMFSHRAGRMISLRDRIQECFVRSENGTPLGNDDSEMEALISYIEWISGHRAPGPIAGRGLIGLPNLKGDPAKGEVTYRSQCAGCHGLEGRGDWPLFPPLWGEDSFNDGAGMNKIPKMAAFIQHNMPQNRPGVLSAQDAFDLSAFIHLKPRPHFDQRYSGY